MDLNADVNDSRALDFSSYLPYVKTEKESLEEHFQPLDYRSFSSYSETNENESTEPPILDLSCKKTAISPTSSELRSTYYGSRSNSPANSDHLVAQQRAVGNFYDSERKSPLESRTFMITPPSETDSPKKNKLDSIYEPAATTMTTSANNNVSPFSILPMNIPLPIVTTVLPTLLGNGDVTKQTGQILGAQLPATSIPSTNLKESTSAIQAEATAAAVAAAKKAPRPFKAYPKDPLTLAMGSPELIYTQNSNETYSEFRKRMLESVKRSNEGTNTKMRRTTKSPGLPTSTVEEKDAAYWERRKRNNEAAKRSRDARRAKEDEIAIRAAFLEQENMKLKYELVALRNETAKLKCMVYST